MKGTTRRVTLIGALLLLAGLTAGAAALALRSGGGGALEDVRSAAEAQAESAEQRLLRQALAAPDLPPGLVPLRQVIESNQDAAAKDPLAPPEEAQRRYEQEGRLVGVESHYQASDQTVFSQPGNPLFQVIVTTTAFQTPDGARAELEYRRRRLQELQQRTALALESQPQFEQVRILTSPVPAVGEDRFSYHLEARLLAGGQRILVLYEYITFLRSDTLSVVVAASVGGPSPIARALAQRLDQKLQGN